MMMRGISAAVVCAAAGVLVLPERSWAQAVFTGGTASITHNERADGRGIRREPPAPLINPFALPAFSASTLQYNSATAPLGNIVFGPATSTARAGVGQVTQPGFFGVGFATGTNLTQRGNPDPTTGAASTLAMPFSAQWTIGPGGVANLTAGASMGLVGSVPAPAPPAFTQINLSATFQYRLPGSGTFANLRAPINQAAPPGGAESFFRRNTPGLFTAAPSNMAPTSPRSLPAGTVVQVSGVLTLLVHNDDEESRVKLEEDAGALVTLVGLSHEPDAPAPAPEAVSLGTPSCVEFEPRAGAWGSGTVQWFKITTRQSALFGSGLFLDVALERLSAGREPAALGLYREDGSLAAQDRSSGARGIVGQLSLGGGRRPARSAGGADFDGRSGDLPAGTYFLAIGGGDTVFNPTNFDVQANPEGARNSATVRVLTNTGRDCPPSETSAPRAIREAGLLGDGETIVDAPLDPTGVAWVTFSTRAPVGEEDPSRFLTIDTGGTVGVDTMIALYDASGRAVSEQWFDDDSYGDGLSQLDFRQAGAARPSRGPARVPLDGRNGRLLPAGTYFLSLSPFSTMYGAGGWAARTEAPAAGGVRVTIRSGRVCATDFNRDGTVDPDDLADFIAAYFASPPGPGTDVNGDGQVDPDDLSDYVTAYFSGC